MANRRRRTIEVIQGEQLLPAEILRSPPAKSATVVRPADSDGSIEYIAGSATERLVDACLSEPTAWRQAKNGSLRYGDPAGTSVSIGNPTSTSETNGVDLYNELIGFGDEVAQTLLFTMAKCLGSENPTEKVRFHVNDSLEFRGFKRHKHRDFRPELKRKEARRFGLLSEVWVTVNDTIQIRAGRGTRSKEINVSSRFIEFELESEKDESGLGDVPALSAPSSVVPVPFGFRVGLGGWAKAYLQSGNLQVRRMFSEIARYDLSTDVGRYAMRIGLAVVFRGTPAERTVEALLSDARIPVPTRHRDRFKSAIEDAFEKLAHDRVIPLWQYTHQTELPATYWFPRWLNWRVSFGGFTQLKQSPDIRN